MEYALTGDPFDAEEAARWGLVNRLTEPGDAPAAARDLAARIAANCPLAVRATKEIITHGRAKRRMIGYGCGVAARTARAGVPALIAEALREDAARTHAVVAAQAAAAAPAEAAEPASTAEHAATAEDATAEPAATAGDAP